MNQLELGIVLVCYTVAAVRELKDGNGAMAWVWACYAASLVGFMAMRVK
jgi:predicted phage gp36 major capsid-like protein